LSALRALLYEVGQIISQDVANIMRVAVIKDDEAMELPDVAWFESRRSTNTRPVSRTKRHNVTDVSELAPLQAS